MLCPLFSYTTHTGSAKAEADKLTSRGNHGISSRRSSKKRLPNFVPRCDVLVRGTRVRRKR